nr:RsmB/NOP family class I SAM-dependent RNA methyltransferase [uncultured Romboutsia sp.]
MKKLPQRFLDDMKELLMDEYDDFIKSYDEPKTTGLRINTLKINKEELLNLNLYNLTPIPWADEGFYYDEEVDRPGKSPLHESGAYYLQEPSAMSVVPHLDIKEGDKVLDMCAAPGGKSTYILSKLNDTGLLVSNEINPTRIRALGENLERFGVRNCIITNTDSNNLRKVFTGYFDKIVIDAPCSGQGMFRKDEVAIEDWSYAKVLECQSIQKDIIRDGYDMLKNGGVLVYSTCTFAKEENEDVINEFISEYKDAKLIEMQRIWPHKVSGEGHFVAKIQKLENEDCNVKYIKIKNNDKEVKDYREFEKKFLNISMESRFDIRGENLYLLPEEHPDTKNLKVLRYGLHLGMLKKNRFEPSHALSHYLKMEDVKNVENFSIQDNKILDYLRGNTIETGKSRGWVLVCVEGIGLGWGKESNGILKNHYPKGLRINY